MTRYFYYYILSICLFSDPNLISLLQKKDSGSLCLSFLAAVPKRKYRLVVCSYFLCPGLSGRPISLSSHCWAPCFFCCCFFFSIAVAHGCHREWETWVWVETFWRGAVIFVDATPPFLQHKAIREVGLPPENLTPRPSNTHFPQELPARKRTYTKMYKDVCLEYIYMKHKTRKGKF